MVEKYRIENEGSPNGSKAWKHVFADLARYCGYFAAIAVVLNWVFVLRDLPRRIEDERVHRTEECGVISARIGKLEQWRELALIGFARVEEHEKRLERVERRVYK